MPKYTLLHCYIAKLLNRKQYNNKTIQQFNNFKEGFSLVEIIISLFLVGILGTILITTSNSFLTRRRQDLSSIAAKAATLEIERLRNKEISSISPASGLSCSSDFTQAGTPSYLPGCQIARTVADFGNPSDKIKQIGITVSWTFQNQTKNIVMQTLMTSGGLQFAARGEPSL